MRILKEPSSAGVPCVHRFLVRRADTQRVSIDVCEARRGE
jgi:hypothetical protein